MKRRTKIEIKRKLKEKFGSLYFGISGIIVSIICALITEGIFGVFGATISTPEQFFLSVIRVFLVGIIVKAFMVVFKVLVDEKKCFSYFLVEVFLTLLIAISLIFLFRLFIK